MVKAPQREVYCEHRYNVGNSATRKIQCWKQEWYNVRNMVTEESYTERNITANKLHQVREDV